MGTRALTCVFDGVEEVCTLYRQHDGYPSGHGVELLEWLCPITMVNGLRNNGTPTANGAGCLAAQMVAHFKKGPGGFYLYAPGTRGVGEEFRYEVYVTQQGSRGGKIHMEIYASEGEPLFQGDPAAALKWALDGDDDVDDDIDEDDVDEVATITMADYQQAARATAIYPPKHGVVYTVLKLASEAGEVAGKLGKMMRDTGWLPGNPLSIAERESLAEELGDVLWYVSQLAAELGLSLDEVAKRNLAKLADRQERGVLAGSGDNR